MEVLHQLQNISSELHGSAGVNANLDEKNLSFEKLKELKMQLLQFQNEKVIFSLLLCYLLPEYCPCNLLTKLSFIFFQTHDFFPKKDTNNFQM